MYLAECRRILESDFNQDDIERVDKLLSNAKQEYGIIYKQKEYTYARHLSIEMDLFIGFYHLCANRMYVDEIVSFLDLKIYSNLYYSDKAETYFDNTKTSLIKYIHLIVL